MNGIRLVCLLLFLAVRGALGTAVALRDTTLAFNGFSSYRFGYFDAESRAAMTEEWSMQRPYGTVRVPAMVLENSYIRVVVCPQMGGSLVSVFDKTDSSDLFYSSGEVYDTYPFLESGESVSFPYHEAGTSQIRQPAGYRVVHESDGAITVAMWMEFSRFNRVSERRMYGRHSGMLLSRFVTVSPHRRDVAVTYRVTNATPYRQGRRMWQLVRFPRHHLSDGIVQGYEYVAESTATEIILPAERISDHRAKDERTFTQHDTPLSKLAWRHHCSLFTWDIQYPFSGAFYPLVDVNRLRITDPEVLPGTKYYFRSDGDIGRPPGDWETTSNVIEQWGGSTTIFEGVEEWIGPGQTWSATLRYLMCEGIGKVVWADSMLCMGTRKGPEGIEIGITPVRDLDTVSIKWNSAVVGEADILRVGETVWCTVAGDSLDGTLNVTVRDSNVLHQRFPLDLSVDSSAVEAIRRSTDWNARRAEMMGLPNNRGENCRDAIGMAPDSSVARGRLLYRDGYIRPAIEVLRKATEGDPENGEGWYLRGVCRYELGEPGAADSMFSRALSCSRPYGYARLFRASIAAGNKEYTRALSYTSAAMKDEPAWEIQLFHAWLLSRTNPEQAWRLTEKLDQSDPADPRPAYLRKLIASEGERISCPDCEQIYDNLLREPGAERRVREFIALTEGRLVHPLRVP